VDEKVEFFVTEDNIGCHGADAEFAVRYCARFVRVCSKFLVVVT
jgi:hypothetical protein